MTWPKLPCPGIRQAWCGYMLTISPWGPEWCPGCERTFTAAEQRDLHERVIHGWPPRADNPLLYND
jgi:hypothetical protein